MLILPIMQIRMYRFAQKDGWTTAAYDQSLYCISVTVEVHRMVSRWALLHPSNEFSCMPLPRCMCILISASRYREDLVNQRTLQILLSILPLAKIKFIRLLSETVELFLSPLLSLIDLPPRSVPIMITLAQYSKTTGMKLNFALVAISKPSLLIWTSFKVWVSTSVHVGYAVAEYVVAGQQ